MKVKSITPTKNQKGMINSIINEFKKAEGSSKQG